MMARRSVSCGFPGEKDFGNNLAHVCFRMFPVLSDQEGMENQPLRGPLATLIQMLGTP